MTAVFIGPTEIIKSVLFPSQADAHMKDWRWYCFKTGNYRTSPFTGRIIYGVTA